MVLALLHWVCCGEVLVMVDPRINIVYIVTRLYMPGSIVKSKFQSDVSRSSA